MNKFGIVSTTAVRTPVLPPDIPLHLVGQPQQFDKLGDLIKAIPVDHSWLHYMQRNNKFIKRWRDIYGPQSQNQLCCICMRPCTFTQFGRFQLLQGYIVGQKNINIKMIGCCNECLMDKQYAYYHSHLPENVRFSTYISFLPPYGKDKDVLYKIDCYVSAND